MCSYIQQVVAMQLFRSERHATFTGVSSLDDRYIDIQYNCFIIHIKIIKCIKRVHVCIQTCMV